MKQTLEDYIRQDEKFRQALLNQEGGIMKYWAQHPEAEFDSELFEHYEEKIKENFIQVNKRNRAICSLSQDELRRKAFAWYNLEEKELHYQLALQPVLTKLPNEVKEQANHFFQEYLTDSYREFLRYTYRDDISAAELYNKIIRNYSSAGLARDCMNYVLRAHHLPEARLKRRSEYGILREFYSQQYCLEVICQKDIFRKLRDGVKATLAGKTSVECRCEAIKMMNMVKDFSRMIYASSEVTIGDYKVDKEFLRNLAGTDAALRLMGHDKDKVPPLHECFFYYVHTLKEIGCIWAAQLLKRGIDMHVLEKETGAILYPVTEPTQWPDGADHGNYRYYVDKDLLDPLDDQCCIYDEKQAKELLDVVRKKKLKKEDTGGSNNMITENLASILKDDIQQLTDNINNQPEQVIHIGKIIAKSKFDRSLMVAIICGLKEDWLMDKAIQVMVDTWNEYANKKDERCYKKSDLAFISYEPRQDGIYNVTSHATESKHLFLKRDLENIKEDELERRKVDEKFNKKVTSTESPGKETAKAKTPKGSKAGKKKGVKQLIEDTKKTAPQKYYTIKYFRPDDNKNVVERKKSRVKLLFEKWQTSNIKTNDGCWGWLDARVSSNDFMKFFEGKDHNCNLLFSKCNNTILTIFLRFLLNHEISKGNKKEKLIEHQTYHSAKSIISEQFGAVANYEVKRLDNETIRRIKESIYILDFTLPLPPLNGGGDNDFDTSDDALQQYSANIDLGINPNVDVDQAVKSGMLKGGKHT